MNERCILVPLIASFWCEPFFAKLWSLDILCNVSSWWDVIHSDANVCGTQYPEVGPYLERQLKVLKLIPDSRFRSTLWKAQPTWPPDISPWRKMKSHSIAPPFSGNLHST